MKYPFFASFIVFCVWLAYEIRKHRNIQAKTDESFWEREARADNVRRKSLDDLNYITIPFEELPTDVLKDEPDIRECLETLYNISEGPIVNFTGISNTDLKLMYGAPNLDLLSIYDQRYTTLVTTLQKWAGLLYDHAYVSEARTVLEFAVKTRTDISASYKLLAGIYRETGQTEKINELLPIAENLNSALSGRITASLQDMLK